MSVCLTENSLMEGLIREYLRIYFGDVDDYSVSHESDGSIHISVWLMGKVVHLTLEQLLMKLGEWHYTFFEVYLQSRYGRSHCTSVYIPGSASAEYVPVYSPAKKKIKGDRPVHSEEVTDGNTGSRGAKKGGAAPGLSLYHISTPKNWRATRQPSTQACNFAHPFQTASQPGRPVCLELLQPPSLAMV